MPDKQIINHLTSLITQANAHVTFDESVERIPFEKLGIMPGNLPYSIWMLVEHIRIAQADILDFSINENYTALTWPAEYWPPEPAPKDEKEWQICLEQIKVDRGSFISLLNKPGADLFSPFPHGDGQNLFREALLIADHASYHTGQIILIRRLLNEWD
ncbi:MAG: transporter [Segetibacter sp.]|nr:transporter [Segetibacter sp.]